MFRIILITFVLTITTATNINQCKSGPLPSEVRVKGCDTMPCSIIKGTTAELDVDFTTVNEATQLITKVRATVLGITTPYPLPDKISNVCSNLLNGQQCPLDAGEDATYKFLFPIEEYYPAIGVTVEVTIEDQNKNIVTCFKVDIKVKA